MAIYRYQHGDRPLEGFTIQHGLGRGGFGEVYYAISDAGREVALKAVQNYEDIELRGIRHCMNLKHPQLVSIFDIKHSAEQLPFVVMEYIDGPSLREILDSHPDGLGPAKAAFFLREIAKGLGYLHDCGVVHRDLKPHNIFYEQGVVKLGDYSLSKAITINHRSGHTMTVGSVHYMAPEISMGRYDNTVDIYALGVLLYEMLTGKPPFLGETMGEVLMKHVAGDVNVTSISEPFARVVRKAMAKEPTERYQSPQEMVDDMMGHADLQQSVASLGPDTLTVIADRAMAAVRENAKVSEPVTAAYVGNRDQASPADSPAASGPSPWKKTNTEDPYRYNFDLRPKRWRKGNVATNQTPKSELGIAYFRPLVPWILGIFTLFALGATMDVGHPGPIFIMAFAWAIYGVLRPKSKGKVNAPTSGAHPNPGEVRDDNQLYAAELAANPNPAVAPAVESPRFAHAVPPPVSPVRPAQPGTPNFDDINESPYSRLVALVMSCLALFVPVAGLQRIYVGRMKTGVLWLCTFGLLGLGQIYDTVMIALGQFRDADGNRVLNFTREKVHSLKEPVNQYSAVARQRWTESRVGFKLGNLLFNLLGAAFLLVALAAGAIVAVDIPHAIASGVFGEQLRDEIARDTAFREWSVLADAVLGVATLVLGVVASCCLVFARRESTWLHMLRIPVAATAFVGSILCLGSSTQFGRRWPSIAEHVIDEYPGSALRELLTRDFWGGLILAAILFVFAIFVLAWPAKRRLRVEEPVVDGALGADAKTQERQRV